MQISKGYDGPYVDCKELGGREAFMTTPIRNKGRSRFRCDGGDRVEVGRRQCRRG